MSWYCYFKITTKKNEKYKEDNNIIKIIGKKIANKFHIIKWENHSYNKKIYMKNKINLNKESKEKLKNPIYRLDYLKEYALRNLDKNQN